MIKSLHIKNFRSFPNCETVIDFSEGINLVEGVNGSGKSSIMNALLWGIWGKCNYKKADITNVSTNGECWVKVEISVSGGTELIIERTMKSLDIKYDGEKLSFPSIAAANAFIVKHIGMRYNIASFLMAFSGESCLTTMTPAKRREIVEIIMGLDIIKAVNDKAKAYVNASKNEIDALKSLIGSYQTNIENIKSIVANNNNISDDDVKAINEKLEVLKDEYESNITKQKTSMDSITEMRSTIMKLSNAASILKSKKDDLIYRANAIKSMDVCPTCRQSVTEAIKNSIIEDYRKDYNEIDSQWETSKKEYEEADRNLQEATNAYNDIQSNLAKINSDVIELRSSLAAFKQSSSIISQSESTIANIEKDIADRTKELNNMQDRLNIMSHIYEKTKKDSECILQVVGMHLDIISKHASNIIGAKITFNPDYTITATGRNMDISVMSNGEQKRIDFALKLALLDTFMTTTSEVDVCFIDESLANVDIYAICDIVKLLRKYTHHRHIGMYLMHHAQIDYTLFDAVMHISKVTGYSMIDVTHDYIA